MRAAVVCLVVALLAPAAHADRKVALKFFRAGEKAYQAQNFEAAAQNFYAAYEALPLPEIAFSAAQAFRRQYRVDPKPEYVQRAVELYTFYLAKVKQGGRVGDAADSLDSMQRELDKLGAKNVVMTVVEKTQLGVTVSLAGVVEDTSMREVDDARKDAIVVTTKIDGKEVRPDEMIDLEPGEHVVRAEAPGFAPIEKKETAIKDHSELVEIELQPLPARIKIATERAAKISIDGRGLDGATAEIPAGRHVITIVRRGREPVSRELVVARGEERTITQTLEPTTRRKSVKIVAGVAIGLGVISLVTGGAAVFQDREARQLLAELRTGNHPPGTVGVDYENARDFRDQLVTGTWVAGAAAAGVGLTAVLLYYFDTPSAEGIRVTPIAGPGVGGAQVIGRF